MYFIEEISYYRSRRSIEKREVNDARTLRATFTKARQYKKKKYNTLILL